MPRLVKASEATAARRRVYFQLVGSDGITPVTTEAAGQPQISTNGAAWTNTGIGVLSAVGNGRYYADLTTAAVATSGDEIETRYKSASTAECPGDSVQVVSFDPANLEATGFTAAALAQLFTLATGQTAATSVAQSVVYEILNGTSVNGDVITNSASGKTLISNASGSVSTTKLLRRGDSRVFCDLCADDGAKILLVNLPTNANFIALADDALGYVEQMCFMGGRYTAADLAVLLTSDTAAGASLYRLVYRLMVIFAYERRVDREMQQPWIYEQVEKEIQRIADGQAVWFLENMDAGRINIERETDRDVDERRGLVRRASRYFGKRPDTLDP